MSSESVASGRRLALGIVAICSLGFSVAPLVNAVRQPEHNKDYSLWLGIGLDVRRGEPLYRAGANGEATFLYPPTAAVLLAPPTHLGPAGFVGVLLVITAASWAGCVFLVGERGTAAPRWCHLLPLIATGPYVYDLFLLGQVNLFLLFVVLVGSRWLREGRPLAAGMCLGLAIAIKVFPLPILAYWIARREGRAVAATLLALVTFIYVLPGAVRGFERNALEVEQWFDLMLGDQSGERMAARSSVGFTRRNQSLFAVVHRWTRPVDADEGLRINIVDVEPRTAQRLGLAAILALAAALVVSARGRFAISTEAEAIETAMVLTLTVLCSPLAWTYFFCWLLPAWVVVLNGARTRRWAIVPIACAGLFLASAISEQFDPRLQAYGVTAMGSLLLFLILATYRWRLKS